MFEDKSVRDVPRWMVANLDAELWPAYDMVWGNQVKWKPPLTTSRCPVTNPAPSDTK